MLLVCAVLLAIIGGACRASGLESIGNTDGLLTWDLGRLEGGASAREVVLFAFDESAERVADCLERARQEFADLPEPAPLTAEGSPAPVAWIRNDATDFALDQQGSFFWEGDRQSLTGPAGGQLSRVGYYVHYGECRMGTRIVGGGAENLRVLEPVRAVSQTEAVGLIASADGTVRLRIRARMGSGPVVGVEFVVTNTGAAPLDAVRLTVYANLEAAHTHEGDYSTLDAGTGGLLTYDPATGLCVVMAGLHRPSTGFCGVWASQEQLETAFGLPAGRWGSFGGPPRELQERLAREAIPHPIAPWVEPREPETRTLTPAEADAILEQDWLFQAEGKPLEVRAQQEIGWARELAARLQKNPACPDLGTELAALDGLAAALEALGGQAVRPDLAKRLYLSVRRIKRAIMFRNPAVDFTQLLFIDQPYPQGSEWPHQARHRNGMMAMPGGRLLVLDGLEPGGRVRKLAADKPGSFWRPDLSFDARRVLYCYKAYDEKSFHLYEVNLDGNGRRQLTFGDYDDTDPIYLPDGHIIFTTTRCNTYVRCMPYTYSYVLARCNADGSDIYLISQNSEPDWCPSLLNDGRVIYSRWEYTDKALWRIQSLWTTGQDGTGTATFWGNQSVWPDHLAEPRAIPGSSRVMFTGLAHHDWFAGSIGIIDPSKGFNFPDGLTKVTADVPWPECGPPPIDPWEAADYHTSGAYNAYKTPYPLSEEDFLVSARREDGKYRLYLMDVHGNRELIYEGAYNIWHALPVRPRVKPPCTPDRVKWPGTGKNRRAVEPGIFYSADVYEGVPDLPRGSVKYLRVLQMDARTCSTWTRDSRFSGPCISLIQDDGLKRILGTAPVEPDGSAYFRVPAGKALHFQMLDEHYRALQTMRTFTGAMPGEVRGCVGCHELHSVAPPVKRGMALRRPPSDLQPPPWGTATISYERLVQPVLDRYCGSCHQGQGQARTKLDLTLRPGYQFYKEPYPTLVGWAQFSGMPPSDAPGYAGAILCENFAQSDPASYVTFRPMKHLSFTSVLVHHAMSGEHHGVKVDPVSLQQLIAWVDANCPYRGEEDVRAIPDPVIPGLPVPPKCASAPVIERP